MRSSVSFIAIAALLTACSGEKPASSSTATGGTVILALFGDAISIYPPSVIDLTGRLVQDQVFDRLAEIGQDLNTIGDKDFSPRLAQKWTWAPDSLSIAFTIDPRARWHGVTVRMRRDTMMSEARTIWQDMEARRSIAVSRQRSGVILMAALLIAMCGAEVLFLTYVAGPDTVNLLTAPEGMAMSAPE